MGVIERLKSLFNILLDNKKKTAIVFSIFLILLLAVFIWKAIYVPVNAWDKELVIFQIKKGDSVIAVAHNLKDKNLIRGEMLFRLYVISKGMSANIQAGTYELSPSMSISQIAWKFFNGESVKREVKIIEGWDLNDIFNYLIDKKLFTKEQISKAIYSAEVQDFISNYKYLDADAKKTDYEGFFFPDTYKITLDTSAEDFVMNIFSNFNDKLTPDLRKEIERQKKSVFEIVIMASIIEKEVKKVADKKVVSGILWKRMKIGMPLQVDSTLLYNNEDVDGNRVLISDTKIDSPYNTYKYKGLVPGPICNPGIESIKAAIYPTNTNYLYYLSASNGTTIFSENFEQHKAAKAKYLR